MTPEELGARLLQASDEEIASLLDQATSSPECLVWMLNQAAQILLESPELAIRAAEVSQRIAELQGNFHSSAIAYRTRALALKSLGRNTEALASFDAATDAARRAGTDLLVVQVQIGAIDSLTWLGRHAEAVGLANRLLEEFRRLGAPQDAARVLVNLGIVYYRQDRYRNALECYEEAAVTLAASGDPVAAATVDFNRASIYSELLQSDRAMLLFNGARAAFDAGGLATYVAMCEFNIGVLHHGAGRYAAALASQQRAMAAFAENSQALEVAKCTADMADVYRMLNLHSESLTAYNNAISVFQQIPLDYELARAQLGRAAVLAAEGNSLEAGEALQQAEDVFRRQRNKLQIAQARLLRAYWLRESGDVQSARREALAAAAAYTRLRMHARAAEARYVEVDIALESGENAIARMAGVCRVARAYRQGWLESRAERAMGAYYASQGRAAAALKHFRAGVEALESSRTLVPGEELHTAFISNKLAVYEDIVGALISRGRGADLTEALEYVERSKSRLLLERVQSALSDSLTPMDSDSTSGRSGPDLARLSELRAQLNRMYSQIHPDEPDGGKRLLESPRENAQKLEEVEREYRAGLREAETESGPGLFSLLRVVSSSELQSWMAPDETLVEYYVLHGTICAFVLSKSERVKVFRNLASLLEIEHTSRRLRYHLKRAGGAPGYVDLHKDQFLTGVQLPLANLFDQLIRPLLPWIQGENITVVPHGALHGLPFHAFYDSDLGEYVLDRWEISYSPSATVRFLDNMTVQAPISESTDALVMGVPDVGLEQIKVEVAELAAILPHARVFCGDTATVSTFREFAGRSNLIHLATHALFRADNPLFSGLKFADGWLLARDLYSMRLNCDLVTLSACRTGQALVESGDEMFGLLRGFLAAGARAVAVSLWPAEDLPTASLMTRFHALMAEGQSRTAALRLAQKCVRRTWQHPYQWAAFALFGER